MIDHEVMRDREQERIDRTFRIDQLTFFPDAQEQGLGEVFRLGMRPGVAAHKPHDPVEMRIEQGAEGFGVAFPETDKQCGQWHSCKITRKRDACWQPLFRSFASSR